MKVLKRLVGRLLSFLFSPVLAFLGYKRKEIDFPGLEECSFYSDANRFQNLFGVHRGYLASSGWLETKHRNASIVNREVVPWISFPALHFLQQFDLSEMFVVEFGAGASTVWFSRRAAHVTSYEFDPSYLRKNRQYLSAGEVTLKDGATWHPLMSDAVAPNPSADLLELFEEDIAHACAFEVKIQFSLRSSFFVEIVEDIRSADLILIDGGPRNLFAALAAMYASADCLVIVDNSDLDYLAGGTSFLRAEGFTEIPFHGIGPINPYSWTTSVFVRGLAALKD